MTEEQDDKTIDFDLSDALADATLSDREDIYSNHAQVVVTDGEIIIDFYKLGPGKRMKEGYPLEATRVQRVYLPHSLGKGLVDAIANSIINYQEKSGIELPNHRDKRDTDKVNIWD